MSLWKEFFFHGKLELLLCRLTHITFLLSPFLFVYRLSRKCFSIRELTMKKTVRPAVSKGSADRGKSEAVTTGGKPPAKSTTVAPLSKVKFIK